MGPKKDKGGAKKDGAPAAAAKKPAAKPAAGAAKPAAKKPAAAKPAAAKPAAGKPAAGKPAAAKPAKAGGKENKPKGKAGGKGGKAVLKKNLEPIVKKSHKQKKLDKIEKLKKRREQRIKEKQIRIERKESAKKVVKKALKAKQKVLKGPHGTRTRKIRTCATFKRPRTLKLPRHPKYPRKSHPRRNKMDAYSIIKHPLTTESAMKKIEDNNTLVFIVDIKANKHHIAMAVKKMYDIDVSKINTLIRPDGRKKAYVRLKPDYDALDVANKIGII